MIGTYTLRQDGKVIGVANNLITTAGKKVIQRYIAGQVGVIAESIAIGTGGTPATALDPYLQFEFDRATIDLVSPDFINGKLIFRATFQQTSSGLINEIGMFSTLDTSSPYPSKLLMLFDSGIEAWTGGAFALDNNRIGGDGYRISPPANSTLTANLSNIRMDLSGYSNSDRMSLAYYVTNAYTRYITVRFKVDNLNYFEYIINAPSAGYNISSFYKNNFTLTGIPTWNNIYAVDILITSTAAGSATVDLDGFRIDDSDYSNPNYVLVSRAIPTDPILKLNTSPLEIEYSLDVLV